MTVVSPEPRRVEKETSELSLDAEARAKQPYTYVKAIPLRDMADVDAIKREVEAGNILIVRIAPLAKKSIDDVKKAINELREHIEFLQGDIARLGEERIVLTPSSVKIWKGKVETQKPPDLQATGTPS